MSQTAEPISTALLEQQPMPRRRPWHRTAMHWIRRLHLYSGLFMFPWVLLYGITAFLFNHPGAFPDQRQISFGNAEIQGTPLKEIPKPEELAEKVVMALERKAGRSQLTGRSFRLVEPGRATYSREFVFARATTDGQQHTIRVSVSDGCGRIATRGVSEPTEKAPFAQHGLKVDGTPSDLVQDSLPTLLERTGLPAGDVTVTSSPELTFLMEEEGKRWKVTYNTLTGEITGRGAEEAPDSLTTRTFLLRLHLAHGFPGSVNARWFWAVAVDAMFISMVFWGLSGVFMFWQIKAVRRWGIAVLLVSAASAAALVFGMHGELAR
jgi:hypothetical protein